MAGDDTRATIAGQLALLLAKQGPAWLLLAILVVAGILGGKSALERFSAHLDHTDAYLDRSLVVDEKHLEAEAATAAALARLAADFDHCCSSSRARQ